MPCAAWSLLRFFVSFLWSVSSVRQDVHGSHRDVAPISLMAKLNAAANEEKSFEVNGEVDQIFTLAKDGYRGAGAFAVVFQVSKPSDPGTTLVAKFLKMDPGPDEWPEMLKSLLSDESTQEAGQERGLEVDWDLVRIAQRSLAKLISLGSVATFGGEIPVQIWEDAGSQTVRDLLQSTEQIDATNEAVIASKLLAVLYLLSIQGLEHGDIKSDNLMFDGGVLKVIDFDSMMRADTPIDIDATVKLIKELHGKHRKPTPTTKAYRLVLKLQDIWGDVAERLRLLAEASRAYGSV